MGKTDGAVQMTKRMASAASLMAPINARLEKIAAVAHALVYTDIAKGTTKISKAKRARLRGSGLSDKMQDKVIAEMRKHVEWDSRGRVKDLHAEDWNYNTADQFAMSVRRDASFTIQRNDIADLPVIVYNPAGRLLLQFKSFMFGSVVKQLERGHNYADIETFTSFMSSIFMAGTAYIGQTYIDYATDPEKRAEMLSPENIAGAAYQRAGFAAITTPFVATAAELAGFGDVVNHRTSGLATSLLSMDQNPTTQLLRSLEQTIYGSVDLLSPTARFDDKDVKRALTLLPFNRVLGVKNGLHLLEESAK